MTPRVKVGHHCAVCDTMFYAEECEVCLANELDEIKRQHTRLREAAKAVSEFLVWPDTNPTGTPSEFLNAKGKKIWRALRAALDSTPAELSKQDLEQVPRPWLELENENLKKNLAALEKHLEKMK